MPPVRLKPVAPQSRVKHSNTEPLRSLPDRMYVVSFALPRFLKCLKILINANSVDLHDMIYYRDHTCLTVIDNSMFL